MNVDKKNEELIEMQSLKETLNKMAKPNGVRGMNMWLEGKIITPQSRH